MNPPALPSYYPPPLPPQATPKLSAVKAGWICIGVGFLTCWTLIGMIFFSVAMILAVVAMFNNRIGEGIAILISAIGSLALCGVLMMLLIFGTIFVGAAKQMEDNQKQQNWPSKQVR